MSKYEQIKPVIQSIVSVFETGNPAGDYGAVVVLKDGAGISYGLHQATDHADNLDEIVRRYIARGSTYSEEMRPLLARLEMDDTASVNPEHLPHWVVSAMALLKKAGHNDEVMREVQREVFDERYWMPAVEHCESMGLTLPLSWAVVYDSCIHSGPHGVSRIRKRFAALPPSKGGDERTWTAAYLAARYQWLSTHQRDAIRWSAVRIRQLQGLADEGNWSLSTPFSFGPPYRVTITTEE